jgi:hypothetical protein
VDTGSPKGKKEHKNNGNELVLFSRAASLEAFIGLGNTLRRLRRV